MGDDGFQLGMGLRLPMEEWERSGPGSGSIEQIDYVTCTSNIKAGTQECKSATQDESEPLSHQFISQG